MSASERLQVLSERREDFGMDTYAMGSLDDSYVLAAALPQIVAVVEAAEKVDSYDPPLRMLDDTFVLHTALSALEEALS